MSGKKQSIEELKAERKELVEAYKKEHQALVEKWRPIISLRSGLDADSDFQKEEREIEGAFQKKLEAINAKIKAAK